MKPLPTLTALLAVVYISCSVGYQAIGVRIDKDGTLREPFALIPIGFLMGAASVVTGTAAFITSCMRMDR
jgi:hypothetical protein